MKAERSARRSARGSTSASPGDLDPTGGAGRQPGLEAAALAGAQPRGLQAEALVQLVQSPQLGGLVAVERDVQRPEPPVGHRLAAGLGELRRERGPRLGRRERCLQAGVLAPARLADRSDHARRDLGGPLPWAGVDDHGAQPGGGRAPRAGQPDDAAADDGEVGAFIVRSWRSPPRLFRPGRRSTLPPPALPGSGSDGRRLQPPSQPLDRGSRCLGCSVENARGRLPFDRMEASARAGLDDARLYFVCDAGRPDGELAALLDSALVRRRRPDPASRQGGRRRAAARGSRGVPRGGRQARRPVPDQRSPRARRARRRRRRARGTGGHARRRGAGAGRSRRDRRPLDPCAGPARRRARRRPGTRGPTT